MTGTAAQKPPRYRTESVHYPPSRDQSKRPERVLLQRTASRNIRRHWLRSVMHGTVLITTDLALMHMLRGILSAIRDGGVFGPTLSALAQVSCHPCQASNGQASNRVERSCAGL